MLRRIQGYHARTADVPQISTCADVWRLVILDKGLAFVFADGALGAWGY